MSTANKLLQAASGGAGDPVYVEDVFSVDLWAGDGSSETITNGIDFSGEGGLAWFARRTTTDLHTMIDTVRGGNQALFSTSSSGNYTNSNMITSFNSNGFAVGSYAGVNENNEDLVSWSFRKQPGFFDIVTYTGNNTGQTLSHNLGCVPAMILIKRYDFGDDWVVYHVGVDSSSPQNYALKLNEQNDRNSSSSWFNNTAPTATQFTVGNSAQVSQGGASFIAYLFAGTGDSDSQIFGENGDQGIIKCGSYTGNGSSSAGPTVTVGFEPQFLMIKAASRDGNWHVMDVNRGIVTDGRDYRIYWDDNSAELNSPEVVELSHSNGFRLNGSSDDQYNGSGETYMYMAIRRPMKPVEYGTEMFLPVAYTGNGTSGKVVSTTFNVDWALFHQDDADDDGQTQVVTRKTGGESGNDLRSLLRFSNTSAGAGIQTVLWGHRQTGIEIHDNNSVNYNNADFTVHLFRRSPEVFDVINYRGDGSAGLAVAHNLGVKPELIIIRKLNSTGNWRVVWSLTDSNSQNSQTNGNDAGSTYAYDAGFRTISAEPTATTFTVGNNINVSDMNTNDSRYAAYLFATKAGVSKVATVVHSGSTDVDCGFSSGARFVMLKRTDATSDWFVWDSVRGIVAGNDPYLRWNVDAADVTNTDYLDPLSSGFTITSSFTAGTYLVLAFA